jgi:CheY-like chemotaxis protein
VSILLVEDNPAILKVTSRMLTLRGHRVRVATSPKEAIALWEQEPADVLVTDVVMPGMSGPDLCAQIERDHPDLQTLFITGYAPDDAELRPLPGKRAVLMKPFRADELTDAVRKLTAAQAERSDTTA